MADLVWHTKPKRILRRDADFVMREQLLLFLKGAAQASEFMVREDRLSDGRTTISVYKVGDTAYERGCVLDLKVLRSSVLGKGRHAQHERAVKPSAMNEHARLAVMRLVRDRQTIGATYAFACFYDARAGQREALGVEPLAEMNDVQLRRFPMPEPAVE